MRIERTDKEILIRVASNTDLVGLQRILDLIQFREITAKSKADQKEVDALAETSKDSWWKKNKARFIK